MEAPQEPPPIVALPVPIKPPNIAKAIALRAATTHILSAITSNSMDFIAEKRKLAAQAMTNLFLFDLPQPYKVTIRTIPPCNQCLSRGIGDRGRHSQLLVFLPRHSHQKEHLQRR
jgi:hypothetical protein